MPGMLALRSRLCKVWLRPAVLGRHIVKAREPERLRLFIIFFPIHSDYRSGEINSFKHSMMKDTKGYTMSMPTVSRHRSAWATALLGISSLASHGQNLNSTAPAAPAANSTAPAPAPVPSAINSTVSPAREVPSGTILRITLLDPVELSTKNLGRIARAVIDRNVRVNGAVAIPSGADAIMKIIAQNPSEPRRHVSAILDLISIRVNGQFVDVVTTKGEDSDDYNNVSRGASPKVLEGAIFGTAAAAGEAAGRELFHRKGRIKLPPETRLSFKLGETLKFGSH
jgi:hypothetical protein